MGSLPLKVEPLPGHIRCRIKSATVGAEQVVHAHPGTEIEFRVTCGDGRVLRERSATLCECSRCRTPTKPYQIFMVALDKSKRGRGLPFLRSDLARLWE